MKTKSIKILCLVFALLFTMSFVTPDLMVKSDAASYKPAKVTNLKVSSKSTNSITLKWSKAKNATKYYVFRYSTYTKKYTTVGYTTSTVYKVSGLSRNTTYIFMVESVRTVKGKNYWGAYSSHLKVTTNSSKSSTSSTTKEASTETTLYNANNDTTKSSGSDSGSNSAGTTAKDYASYSSSAKWAWPLGNVPCYVSTSFGYLSESSISGNTFHGGIDITAGSIYGKPIYATRAGTVKKAVYGTTGYGRYVVIDHGDGFTSIYGQCSNLCVSTGQKVSKGQQIAYVGSTGNSTGPHLHFEIRKDGTKVNPLKYVSKP